MRWFAAYRVSSSPQSVLAKLQSLTFSGVFHIMPLANREVSNTGRVPAPNSLGHASGHSVPLSGPC